MFVQCWACVLMSVSLSDFSLCLQLRKDFLLVLTASCVDRKCWGQMGAVEVKSRGPDGIASSLTIWNYSFEPAPVVMLLIIGQAVVAWTIFSQTLWWFSAHWVDLLTRVWKLLHVHSPTMPDWIWLLTTGVQQLSWSLTALLCTVKLPRIWLGISALVGWGVLPDCPPEGQLNITLAHTSRYLVSNPGGFFHCPSAERTPQRNRCWCWK